MRFSFNESLQCQLNNVLNNEYINSLFSNLENVSVDYMLILTNFCIICNLEVNIIFEEKRLEELKPHYEISAPKNGA